MGKRSPAPNRLPSLQTGRHPAVWPWLPSCATPTVTPAPPFMKRFVSLAWPFLALALNLAAAGQGANGTRRLVFHGVLCEHRLALKDIDPAMPADWTPYKYLVMELKTSSPQRFALWAYTADGPRRIEIQPFGQNVWLRACVPLRYFKGMDQAGSDLASTINRRTHSFWMSVWGPFGDLKSVQAIGFEMQYPLHRPVVEVRNIHLSTTDEGSVFLEGQPEVDQFGQWVHADWPRKIHSRAQLERELAAEARQFGSGADYGYDRLGGYADTHAQATGFFHVEQINGVWWFVDPLGHLFLSTGCNGVDRFRGRIASKTDRPLTPEEERTVRRLASWGFTMGGPGRPHDVFLRWPLTRTTTFLGLPDVYAPNFAAKIDRAAKAQCVPRKDDPLVIGYFIGNEPPWGGRESEVVNMILAGPDTATKTRLKSFLAAGDTPARRQQFVVSAFKRYLDVVCGAVRKYDPHHLILGIRFGSKPADDVLSLARVFDVCSINVYEYEPTKQLERTHRLCGRPVVIGEFHLGVPADGLGAGLVQAANQTERAIGYRYYVEQAFSLPYCIGVHWFTWRDEPVLGRRDGENYNIGFVDCTDRPYPKLVEAAEATNHRLYQVHSAQILPFNRRPKASAVGSPSSPWDL